MRIAICDDEIKTRGSLKASIEEWAKDVNIKTQCDLFPNGQELLDQPDTKVYDLIFLDIYMGEPNGLATAEAIRKTNMKSLIIFLTSSQDHLMEAYKFRAFDYLFKPLKTYRLHNLLNEALQYLPEEEPMLNITVGHQVVPLLYADITHVESDRNYCLFFTRDASYRCRMQFSQICEELQRDYRFLLINRGIMVNMDYVLRIDGRNCRMTDDSLLPINARKVADMEQRLLNFRFEKRRAQGHGGRS